VIPSQRGMGDEELSLALLALVVVLVVLVVAVIGEKLGP